MKKRIVLTLILSFCLISACSQSENEEVGLYDETLMQQSENWEVKLDLKELSETSSPYKRNQVPYEEDTITIKYLKEIDEGLEFHYKWIYGDPMGLGAGPGYRINLQNQAKFIDTKFQQKMIDEVCFGTLILEIHWEDPEGESHKERFVFKDHENTQCQLTVLMTARGDFYW